MSYLGIDIGGTYIKYAVFNREGKQLSSTSRVKTSITATTNYILEQVCQICLEVKEKFLLSGVAISSAGVIDSKKGIVTYSGYTIPNYTGACIKEKVESITKIRCTVINDVNAACLGEYWQLIRKKERPYTMICLTIGTGLGSAIIIDGALHQGSAYMAGEIGYLPIEGQYLQDVASTTSLLSTVEDKIGKKMSGEEFFDCLRTSNIQMISQIFDEFIRNLSKGILTLQYILNPDLIVLGGGILEHSDLIIPKINRFLREFVVSDRFLTAEIRPAQVGNNAGMIGALYYHLNTE